WMLRQFTRLVSLAQRPLHEQSRRVSEWDEEIRNAPEAAQKWTQWVHKMGLGFPKIVQITLMQHARLRCALAALAVERYRLVHGDWPHDLAALVPAYLKDVPNDPYDGQLLRYRRLPEGVVVYCLGPDLIDNQGTLNRSSEPPDGTDIGFQLWDVAKR